MAISVLAIVQARMGSTRLPEKVLKKLNGKTLIEILFRRLSRSKNIDKIILATTINEGNNRLVETVEKLGFNVFRGSENNVLDRFYKAANLYSPETIVRITGDCPIIDPQLVDEIIDHYQERNVDYSNNFELFPDGLNTEVFSFRALEVAHDQATESFDLEHVTPYIRNNVQFKCENYLSTSDLSAERWTVDDPEDLEVIENIINHFDPSIDFSWKEVLDLKRCQQELFAANRDTKRDEGAELNTGQKLWKRAKKVIPGGNMMLSKRPEMFLPEKWPAYFSKAKGCKVWDLDGSEYTDMSIMGIGTNILGYGHAEVDEAVIQTIRSGNMSTFNNSEEVKLAELLIELHPWADMVRFARSGGEANAIAIRIARAAVQKDKIAICGYHGWHDWYLSANLTDDHNLDRHLLPGLKPKGIPQNLSGTVFPFNYNSFEELETLFSEHDIGIIKMEVSRNTDPKDNFLERVRDLATRKNAILVFDECTSGFRETFGGLHKKFVVEPDLTIFGKALGNGYAITAIIGRHEIMQAAQSTFISSTFWTERIGPSAALKTLEVMERVHSWETITSTGKKIGQRWMRLGKKYGLPIEIAGLPALINFTIRSENWIKYKTLITQEMLKKNFLAANSIYVCIDHTEEVVDEYFQHLEPVFATIAECEAGRNIDKLLNGPVCHSGFRSLK